MSSLFGSMSIALRSMLTQQDAISVTANNVANINTPGYSRQRAELVESDAFFNGAHMVGTGVELQQIKSLRDRVLELRIQEEKQQQGALQSEVTALQDLESLFSSDTEGIADSLNKFFNSISQLTTNAASIPLRQSVLMSAENLANQFRSSAATLQQRQFSLDLQIEQAVSEVQELSQQIATVNSKIAAASVNTTETGALEDEKNVLLQKLSTLVGNQTFVADDGSTVTLKDGTPLVVGNKSMPLTVARDSDGSIRVRSEISDITDSLVGGQLGGLLTVRTEVIPEISRSLDVLAGTIATAVNDIHVNGRDLDGNTGANLFSPPAAGNAGAAASMQVLVKGPRYLAASTNGNAGDNSNVNAILSLQTSGVVEGDTPTNYYAKIAFRLGSRISNDASELAACDVVAEQLNNQRGAISGVSLDEEAADLIRFQRAYEAAARVLSVIDELTEISVNLGRS